MYLGGTIVSAWIRHWCVLTMEFSSLSLPYPSLPLPLLHSTPLPSTSLSFCQPRYSRAETWPQLLYLTHYPKVMLEQLKERLDLNSHTACTVTFQFTEPVHNIASLKAITNMDPRDVRSGMSCVQ